MDRSAVLLNDLTTPPAHTVDRTVYALLIEVGPSPLQYASPMLQRSLFFHLPVGFILDVIREVLNRIYIQGILPAIPCAQSRCLPDTGGGLTTVSCCVIPHREKSNFFFPGMRWHKMDDCMVKTMSIGQK